MNEQIDHIINEALKEDIPTIDVTTDNLFTDQVSEGAFIAKEDGVLSGVSVMKRVFEIIDDSIYIKIINTDGTFVEKGDVIDKISGKSKTN